MARRKYIYHHFVNGKEVTKEEFLEQLAPYCSVVDCDFGGGLTIGHTDDKALQRRYDYYKCHPHHTTVYCDSNMSFHIGREEIKK